jgi:amino acid transporter
MQPLQLYCAGIFVRIKIRDYRGFFALASLSLAHHAFIAILFTANSYAIMVKRYPISGSVYTYVSHGVSPHLGFIAGWGLLLDYIMVPTATSVSAVLYIKDYLTHVPYAVILLIYTAIIAIINLLGIKLLARIGLCLLIIGEMVMVVSFIVFGHYVVRHSGVAGLFSLFPFQFDTVH